MDFSARYEFNPKTDLLGKGGFSKVYKARDTLLDRIVALKFFTGSGSEKYQVLNEIRKVIRFEHPNLCKYYDVVVFDRKDVVGESELVEVGVMEYLDAGDLKSYIKNNPTQIDKLLIDVLRGLAFLHRKGIVHRDLKPQNIIVKMEDDEPVAKITDFGLSKIISPEDNNSSALIGTIEYMAPEQFNPRKYGIAGKITTNLDLWSFGLLVYEVLMHKPLFGSRSSGISAEQVMRNILSDAFLNKTRQLPEKYQAIINKCLVKSASGRVQNALELIPLFDGQIGWPDQDTVNPIIDSTDDQPDYSDYVDGDTEILHNNESAKKDLEKEEQTIILGKVPDKDLENENTIILKVEQAEDITEVYKNPDAKISPIAGDKYTTISDLNTESEFPDERADQPTEVISLPSKNNDKAKVTAPEQPRFVVNSSSGPKGKAGYKRLVLYCSIPVVLLIVFFGFRSLRNVPTELEETATSAIQKPGQVENIVSVPAMIAVPAAHFIMGKPLADVTDADFPHEVSLSAFSIAKYETTIDEFSRFIDETRYMTTAEKEGFSGVFVEGKWSKGNGVNWRHDMSGKLSDSSSRSTPVVHVSWDDAMKYCEWLSAKTKKKIRLPTEAEWEFSATGASGSAATLYSGSSQLNDVAWNATNSGSRLHAVGAKKANSFGLHDMSGNVMEWCYDWYQEDYYPSSPLTDPEGASAGTLRVVRGGSWYLKEPRLFYNISRGAFKPNVTGGQLGFRICESAD